MALPLTPILRPGATDNSQLQLYTARDFIGVQRSGEATNRGVNRVAQWTRDFADWVDVEHTRQGYHNTMRIPRGIFIAGFTSLGGGRFDYVIDERSYLFGVRYADDPSIFTLTPVADGQFALELGADMPTEDWGIINACPPQEVLTTSVGNEVYPALVVCNAIDARRAFITRFAQNAPTAWGRDGPVAFALVG